MRLGCLRDVRLDRRRPGRGCCLPSSGMTFQSSPAVDPSPGTPSVPCRASGTQIFRVVASFLPSLHRAPNRQSVYWLSTVASQGRQDECICSTKISMTSDDRHRSRLLRVIFLSSSRPGRVRPSGHRHGSRNFHKQQAVQATPQEERTASVREEPSSTDQARKNRKTGKARLRARSTPIACESTPRTQT